MFSLKSQYNQACWTGNKVSIGHHHFHENVSFYALMKTIRQSPWSSETGHYKLETTTDGRVLLSQQGTFPDQLLTNLTHPCKEKKLMENLLDSAYQHTGQKQRV